LQTIGFWTSDWGKRRISIFEYTINPPEKFFIFFSININLHLYEMSIMMVSKIETPRSDETELSGRDNHESVCL